MLETFRRVHNKNSSANHLAFSFCENSVASSDVTQRRLVSHRRFGTRYRPYLQESTYDAWHPRRRNNSSKPQRKPTISQNVSRLTSKNFSCAPFVIFSKHASHKHLNHIFKWYPRWLRQAHTKKGMFYVLHRAYVLPERSINQTHHLDLAYTWAAINLKNAQIYIPHNPTLIKSVAVALWTSVRVVPGLNLSRYTGHSKWAHVWIPSVPAKQCQIIWTKHSRNSDRLWARQMTNHSSIPAKGKKLFSALKRPGQIWRLVAYLVGSRGHCSAAQPGAVLPTVHFMNYKVVQIWPGLFVCKQVTVCAGHIWTTLY